MNQKERARIARDIIFSQIDMLEYYEVFEWMQMHESVEVYGNELDELMGDIFEMIRDAAITIKFLEEGPGGVSPKRTFSLYSEERRDNG